jgi:pimeloyl-ACP methyl ester carboxylesterase
MTSASALAAAYSPTVFGDRPRRGRLGCAQVTRVPVGAGVALAVRDYGPQAGARHTVVLLHGLCLNQAVWVRQVEYLLRRYHGSVRVISYDHRGHGQSGSAPMSTYSIEQCAGDLAQVLAVLNVTGAVTFVGHSMGGMVALAYLGRAAVDRPVDPGGLVLIATAASGLAARGLGRLLATPATSALCGLVNHTPEQAWRAVLGPLGAVLGRAHSGSSARQTLAAVTTAALATTPLATAVGFLPSLRAFNQYHVLGSIRARTVVLSGGADVLTPPAHATQLVAAIPGCRHVHLADAGHMLPQAAPHAVNDEIAWAIDIAGRASKSIRPQQQTFRTSCLEVPTS